MFRLGFLACIFCGIGLAVVSFTFFLWTWWIGPAPAAFLWLAIAAYIAAGIALFRYRAPARTQPYDILFGSLFSLFCIYTGWLTLGKYWAQPHGAWDAWSIWNFYARLLNRDGAHWLSTSSQIIYGGHPDYPLLLSSLVADGWKLAGNESTVVPAVISVLFAFLGAGLLAGSVGLISTPLRGFLVGLMLVATPDFIREGTNQMADVPLAFFILMTVVLLYVAETSPRKNAFLALAGASAGFACWTKNEGLLFLVCLVAARVLSAIVLRQRIWHDAQIFCIGLLPVLAIVLSYKFLRTPGRYFFANPSEFTGRLTDPSRYMAIAKYFARSIADFGGGRISPLIAVANFLFCFGRRPFKNGYSAQFTIALLLIMMLTGYFMIYVIDPENLQWHLMTSFPRLLIHLWPAFLFCVGCTGAEK